MFNSILLTYADLCLPNDIITMKKKIPSPLGCTALLLLAGSSLHAAVASKDSINSSTTHVTAAESSVSNDHRLSNNNNDILAELTAQTKQSAQSLSQKSAEYAELQSLLSDKLAKFGERRSILEAELSSADNPHGLMSIEAVHESMDDVSLKLLDLMKRTEDVTRRISEFNRAALLGSDGKISGGLQERLMNVKQDEIERRDRFANDLMTRQQDEISDDADNNKDEEDELHPANQNEYMTIAQLDQLLSTHDIITSSDNELKAKLTALAMNMMKQRTSDDEAFWNNHFATLPQKIQEHVQQQQQQQQQQMILNSNGDNSGECIHIPSAVELVANALTLHYQDGGVGMMDVASYENGGSVVHELTSAPYQPSPRNKRQEDEKELGVDKALERMYYEQQHNDMMTMSGDESVGIAQKLDAELDKIDLWNWYTNFKLDSLRSYLPDDWERALDRLSSSGYLGASTANWGEYTPRGLVDALIPDYIYHAFGISNTASYGSVFGRTASPEVAITAGYSKVGGGTGGRGWSAKALGNCYPLSMRPENDPILSLLSRDTQRMEAADVDDEENTNASLLVGPKYTVRLPYPIHIDAVSIEHRAFPLPPSTLNNGVRGGESAPRWINVIGFPPCDGFDGNHVDTVEEECGKLGFDISQPIELGSFEYNPVTSSGGGDIDTASNSESERRRRSIQTFTVKGGQVNESGIEEKGDDDETLSSNEPQLEVEDYEIPAGSCAPPKEPDDVPSCGGDTSSSDESERQVVSAVSFIIKENWGNHEYTCLYRVRVHGDPVSV